MSGDENISVVIGTIYGVKSQQGIVQIAIGDVSIQIDVRKAREISRMLDEAIEAAISDELLVRYLTGKLAMSMEMATRALADFRELRQGTRGTSFPS